MKQFTAKKLGEVLAFATVGNEMLEKNETAFREYLGVELLAHVLETNAMHAKNIRHIGETEGMWETMEKTAKESGGKLEKMRDVYLNDSSNVSDLFEWFSFVEGAAYGHFMVLKGAAERANDEALLELAEDGSTFHYELLAHIVEELEEIGEDKE